MAPITATMIAQSQAKARLAAVFHRLFHNLRPFMRAYAASAEAQRDLPDLDMVWVGGVDGGPENVVRDSIRSYPELWADAIPDECCIVPREVLRKLIGSDATDGLAMQGAAMVENYAARFQHEYRRREDQIANVSLTTGEKK